jgi:hypothetical protein
MLFIRSAAFAALALSAHASAAILVYDPSLGSLPHAQGWSYDGNSTPAMSVSGGLLHHGPTAYSPTSYWSAPLSPGQADFSVDTWSITAIVRISNGTFGNQSGFRRGGFNLHLADAAGRFIHAEMNHASIGLRNDNTGLSDPAFSIDLASDFHTITLQAGPLGGRLFVDNVLLSSLPLGSGFPQSAHWADSTVLGNYTGQIARVSLVPAPASLALLALAPLSRRRR